MKKILVLLLFLSPLLLWGQMTKLDSVNYYFGNLKYFLSDDYTTFKVLYKISYRNYPLENVKQKKNIPFVMVATFTSWE